MNKKAWLIATRRYKNNTDANKNAFTITFKFRYTELQQNGSMEQRIRN